ncbi:hypothetical protein ACTXT7_004114 [Hymenolepis weldensis]
MSNMKSFTADMSEQNCHRSIIYDLKWLRPREFKKRQNEQLDTRILTGKFLKISTRAEKQVEKSGRAVMNRLPSSMLCISRAHNLL